MKDYNEPCMICNGKTKKTDIVKRRSDGFVGALCSGCYWDQDLSNIDDLTPDEISDHHGRSKLRQENKHDIEEWSEL